MVREHHPGARLAVLVDLTVDVMAGGEKNIGRWQGLRSDLAVYSLLPSDMPSAS
jgi:hypothetical protein